MSKLILVVDDEESLRAVVEEFLSSMGYAVLSTGDPSRAIQIAREQTVDLLLSDVVMPIMKGTELADRVQAIRPSAKIVLMSGYTTGDLTGRAFIAKPFALDDLERLVRETLTRPSPFARLTKAPSRA